jgi:hypothetical protein
MGTSEIVTFPLRYSLFNKAVYMGQTFIYIFIYIATPKE